MTLVCILSCTKNEDNEENFYVCDQQSGCLQSCNGQFATIQDCESICNITPNLQGPRVTVFLYENCPIAQYMCGPLREAYRYFCDTLNQEIIFRGFSPNAFSTESSLEDFKIKYDIPFSLERDYDTINNQPGPYSQYYTPIVTPEVFIELNDTLLYRGMIDNSYQSLGVWSLPTENYLVNVLTQIVNDEDICYFETEAIGCYINY